MQPGRAERSRGASINILQPLRFIQAVTARTGAPEVSCTFGNFVAATLLRGKFRSNFGIINRDSMKPILFVALMRFVLAELFRGKCDVELESPRAPSGGLSLRTFGLGIRRF